MRASRPRVGRIDPGELLPGGLLHRDQVRDRTGSGLPVGDTVPLQGATLVVTEMNGRRVATVRFDRSGRPGCRPGQPHRAPADTGARLSG